MNVEPSRFFKAQSPKSAMFPVGGKAADIFNMAQNDESPRKVRDHQKSKVFNLNGEAAETKQNGNADLVQDTERLTVSPKRFEDTKDRLFGTPDNSPRKCKITDTIKSNVFVNGESKQQTTPKKQTSLSPITGLQVGAQNGSTDSMVNGCNGNALHSGHHNGETNGYVNGSANSQANGVHHTPTKAQRPPPGGHSSGIF